MKKIFNIGLALTIAALATCQTAYSQVKKYITDPVIKASVADMKSRSVDSLEHLTYTMHYTNSGYNLLDASSVSLMTKVVPDVAMVMDILGTSPDQVLRIYMNHPHNLSFKEEDPLTLLMCSLPSRKADKNSGDILYMFNNINVRYLKTGADDVLSILTVITKEGTLALAYDLSPSAKSEYFSLLNDERKTRSAMKEVSDIISSESFNPYYRRNSDNPRYVEARNRYDEYKKDYNTAVNAREDFENRVDSLYAYARDNYLSQWSLLSSVRAYYKNGEPIIESTTAVVPRGQKLSTGDPIFDDFFRDDSAPKPTVTGMPNLEDAVKFISENSPIHIEHLGFLK